MAMSMTKLYVWNGKQQCMTRSIQSLISVGFLNTVCIGQTNNIVMDALGNVVNMNAPKEKNNKNKSDINNEKDKDKDNINVNDNYSNGDPKTTTVVRASLEQSSPISMVSAPTQEIKTQPLDSNTIRLIPNHEGNTFRLELKAQSFPNVAIMKHSNGVYVIFDQAYNAEMIDLPGMQKIVDHVEVITNPTNLILKLYLAPFVITRLTEDKNRYFLQFYHSSPLYLNNGIIASQSQASIGRQTWPSIAISGISSGVGQNIRINNQDYYVLMSKVPDSGFQKYYSMDSFDIIPTHQGLAFQIYNNNITFNPVSTEISITPPLEDNIVISDKIEGIYGNLFDIDPKIKIRDEYQKLNEELNKLSLPYPINSTLRAAWYCVQLDLGYEALGLLKNSLDTYPSLNAQPLFLGVMGMAYFLTREYNLAVETWDKMPLTAEFQIWKTIAKGFLGNTDALLDATQKAPQFLGSYGQKLREALIKILLLACRIIDDGDTVQYISENINYGTSYYMNALLSMHLSTVYYNRKNYIATEQMLQKMELKNFREQPEMFLESHYNYYSVNIELYKKALTNAQAMEKFEKMRFYWRDDLLEYRILCQMIQIQKEANAYVSALNLMKTLKSLYPLQATLELIDNQIQSTFYQYSKNYDKKSPMDVINTYSDFTNYIYEGDKGHEMIANISQAFYSMGLIDDTAEILSRSLHDMQEGEKKNKRIFDICDLYIQNKKYDSAIALLESIPLENTPMDQQNTILTLKSKAYFEIGKMNKVVEILKNSTNPNHILFLCEAYIEDKKWTSIIEVLESLLLRLDEKVESDRVILKSLLNQLAFALVMDTGDTPPPIKTSDVKSQKSVSKTDDSKKEKKDAKVEKKLVTANSQAVNALQLNSEISKQLQLRKDAPELALALQNMEKTSHKHQDRLSALHEKFKDLMQGEELFMLLTRPQKPSLKDLKGADDILSDTDTLLNQVKNFIK